MMPTESANASEIEDTCEYFPFGEMVSCYFEVEPRASVQVDFGARTHPGKVRPNNEDNFSVIRRQRQREVLLTSLAPELLQAPDQVAYSIAVADGMGGQQFGEIASLLALRTGWDLGSDEVKWAVKMNEREAAELKHKARVFFQLIHRTLKDAAEANPKLQGMGTTLTICYTVGPVLFVLHAGDSRAYRYRDGQLKMLTRDHSLAQVLIDSGQAAPGSPEERRVRHVLTNSLGAYASSVDVDVERYRLRDGDRLLVCTDGLTDMLSDQEIASALANHQESDPACQALLDLALDRGGKDNITVVIGRYTISDEPVDPTG